MKLQTGARFSAAGALAMAIACAPLAAHAREIAGGVIGCDAPGAKQETGAVIGAVLGGLAGNSLARHNRGTGTVLGATAGAATGSYVGCNMQKRDGAEPARSSSSSSSRARTARIEDDEPEYTDRTAYPRERGFTPPGLAKKPYGMPPGQAKKYYGVGERMPGAYARDARYVLEEPRAYGLRRPPPGYRWVGIGDDAYLVRTKTGVITDVVRAILS
jgi:Ni/Co efflux regulator RcnB